LLTQISRFLKLGKVLKGGFHQWRSRSRSHNQKRRVIQSSENQTDGVGSRTPHLSATLTLTIQWKLDCRSLKQKRRDTPITLFVSGPCDWLVLLFLLPTPTMSQEMETFWFFWLWFCRAYDSAYDSDFWFSLGYERSYDSNYDSNSDSDSITSENQP